MQTFFEQRGPCEVLSYGQLHNEGCHGISFSGRQSLSDSLIACAHGRSARVAVLMECVVAECRERYLQAEAEARGDGGAKQTARKDE